MTVDGYEIKAGPEVFDENGNYVGTQHNSNMPHTGGGGINNKNSGDSIYGDDGGGREEWDDGNDYDDVVD